MSPLFFPIFKPISRKRPAFIIVYFLILLILPGLKLSAQIKPEVLDHSSQQYGYFFYHFKVKDGLSQSTVNCILQDNYGFMWFGTDNGLNRYDGYEIRKYYSSEHPCGLKGNCIFTMLHGIKNRIYIGTDHGLNIFDPLQESFENIYLGSSMNETGYKGPVKVVINDSDSSCLWIGTENGLYNYETDSGKAQHIDFVKDLGIDGTNNITCLMQNSDGKIIAGTVDKGIIVYDPENKEIDHHYQDNEQRSSIRIENNEINSLYRDSKDRIWIGTNNGITCIDNQSFSMIENIVFTMAQQNRINRIIETANGDIWFGTGFGIVKKEAKTNRFIRLSNKRDNLLSISDNRIQSLYIDRDGLFWIGTLGSGVNKLELNNQLFSYVGPVSHPEFPVSAVRGLYGDDRNNIWIGTDNHRLKVFNRLEDKLVDFDRYLGVNSPENFVGVFTITRDVDGNYWFGTSGQGLFIYDITNSNITRFDLGIDVPRFSYFNFIRSVFFDKEGGAWIGTGYGLVYIDRDSGDIIHFNQNDEVSNLSNNDVYSIAQDSSGNIWVGTVNGLNKYNRDSNDFSTYHYDNHDDNSISYNFISSIHVDKKGTIWIGTYGGGLNKYDSETNSFLHYSGESGLSNDIIYSIIEDADGTLWLSTNEGISSFEPESEFFRNYDVRYGLQGSEFDLGSSCITEDGVIVFGGMQGVSYFCPDSITINRNPPDIALTGLLVSNDPIEVNDDMRYGIQLEKSILASEEITIGHEVTNFTIKFSALGFVNPGNNYYSYRIREIDDNWNQLGRDHSIHFSKLKPGTYTLDIIGSNSDGVWNYEGRTVRLMVKPAYWNTLFFKLIVLFSLVAIAITTYKWRMADIKKRNTKLEDQINERIRVESILRSREEEIEKLTENLKIGIFRIGFREKTEIVRVNEECAKMFGYASVKEMLRIGEDDIYPNKEEKVKVSELIESKGSLNNEEILFRKKDGSVFTGSLTAILVRSENKNYGFLDGIILDISEQVKEREIRRELEEQLLQSQKMESIGQMAGGVAHDFNNILTGIQGYAEILNVTLSEPKTRERKSINAIIQGVNRAANLTKQLLGFSRKGTFNPIPLNINDVIKDVIAVSEKIFEKKIKVLYDLEEEIQNIEADKNQMDQVLTNLIINAKDAMPKGGTISIKSRNIYLDREAAETIPEFDEGDYVQLSIKDTGIGMSKDIEEKIFEPFFTTKKVGKGTGLGLSTVYGIVKNHKGRILVESKTGRGTIFTLLFPVTNKEIEPETVENLNEYSEYGRLLFVDDEEFIRDIAENILKSNGHEIITAETGSKALEIFKEKKDEIDIVILDMIMPGLPGEEVFVRLKELNPDIKVIICSGYSEGSEAKDLIQNHASGFLQKPFDFNSLSNLVNKLLSSD